MLVSTEGSCKLATRGCVALSPCRRYDSRSLLHIVRCASTARAVFAVRSSEDLFKDLRVRTVVIPSGDKPSVVADAPEDYAKDTSPDKVRRQSSVVDYSIHLIVNDVRKACEGC